LAALILPLVTRPKRVVPWWLHSPTWLRQGSHAVSLFLLHQTGVGLALVICAEEIGIPLPVPSDVAIMYGGYLSSRGELNYWQAYGCVLTGSMVGSSVLLYLTRRFGRTFILRFGRYIRFDHDRLDQAERAFQRWGLWAIIVGRLIPGMRIIMTALSGILNVPYRTFVPAVFVSSVIWAGIFLELGRRLGKRTFELFHLLPAHLLPWVVLVMAVVALGHLGWSHRPGQEPPPKSA
jgi:membrane protein DedA with SNARE-associated domain